ncbi:MAG TPA: cytochrome P450 [Chthoniobacteraceae bacterium]|nr:cytochrome P450 [Chthoniobacteraceae bacterium]
MPLAIQVDRFRRFRRQPFALFRELAATSPGGFAEIEGARQPLYLVTRPENVHQILVAPTSRMRRWSGSPELREFLGESIINAGETTLRQKTLPAFHRHHLAAWQAQIEAMAPARLAPWLGSGPLNLKHRFEPFTMEVIGRLLFHADLREAAPVVLTHLQRLVIPTYWRTDFDAPLTPGFKATCDAVREPLRLVFAQQREALETSPIFRLLRAEPAASEAQVFEEFCGFILSAIMTTGHTLSAICWHLARHPQLQQELRETTREEPFERVIQEGLRLCPPVWLIGREAVSDVTLCGAPFPAGALFLICPWLMHRIGFEEGEKFLPERWKTNPEPPRGAFLPFSLGVRRCMGQSMAMLLLRVALRFILSRFTLHPDERSPEFLLRPGVLLTMTGDTWITLQTS